MADLKHTNRDRQFKKKPAVDVSTMVFGKIPPQSKELEEAVLGAIMLEKSAFDSVVEIIKPECFYVDAHQRIFKAMKELAEKNSPIDMLTVVEQLKSTSELDIVGGAYYITKLTNYVVSSANIETHSRIVVQKFIQRELIRISGEILGVMFSFLPTMTDPPPGIGILVMTVPNKSLDELKEFDPRSASRLISPCTVFSAIPRPITEVAI